MATITTELIDAKRDTTGRQIRTATEREELLAAYWESGLTQKAFAAREGIRYTTFVTWVQDGRRRRPAAKVAFRELTLRPRPNVGVEVQLPDGTVVRGGQAGEVAQLVRLLRC